MGKDSYYFSHDSNARNDPKILAMRSVYGIEGYGAYWVIIEMLREQEEYKLKKGKYMFNAIAMQMQCKSFTTEYANEFVHDLINEFELLAEDETHIFSESLLKRMKIKDDVSEKRKKAAEKRWGKTNDGADSEKKESKSNANAMQVHSKSNAIKEKEKKEKEIKESKLNKQQQEDENAKNGNPARFYEENGFGDLKPHVGEKLYAWVDDLSNELVIHAMKIAIENNVIKWSYVEPILRDWSNAKIKTVEQVEAVKLQFKKQSTGKKTEELPPWYGKQKQERKTGVFEKEELSAEAEEQKRLLLEKLGVEDEGVKKVAKGE